MNDEMFGPTREYKQTAAKREQTRKRVEEYRKRNRKDPIGKLSTAWEQQLAALPEADRVALLGQQDEARWLTYEMSLVCTAVNKLRGTDSATASLQGESTTDYLNRWGLKLFPDELFREVKAFMERTGGSVRSWSPKECAHYEGVLDSFDDESFKTYGVRSRLWEMDRRQFVKAVLAWAEGSPGDCDPQIQAEAKQLCSDWYPYQYSAKPEPLAPGHGFKNKTRAEENAHQAYLEDRAAFDKSYRQHLLDRLNNQVNGELE